MAHGSVYFIASYDVSSAPVLLQSATELLLSFTASIDHPESYGNIYKAWLK
jgi:hypothetical protein